MAHDQAHEKNNKMVNVYGGAIGLFAKSKGINEVDGVWSRNITSAKYSWKENTWRHIYQSPWKHSSFLKSFQKKWMAEDILITPIMTVILTAETSRSVHKAKNLAQQQYEDFIHYKAE